MKRHIARPEYRAPDGQWMCHCGRLVIRKVVHCRSRFGGNGSRAAHGAIVDKARYERIAAR